MPKQVRLRRGTTAQNNAFTGAEGEITVDTEADILVLHDGATAGGKRLDYLRLSPALSAALQTIASRVRITNTSDDPVAFQCDGYASFELGLLSSKEAELSNLVISQVDLTYAATVNLDFRDTAGTKRLALTGNVTFTSSNLGFGRQVMVKILADGSARNLSFPAGWKFVGAAAPANIAASKTALLFLWSFGSADADVVARYLVEP